MLPHTTHVPCYLMHSRLPHTFRVTSYIPHYLIHSMSSHTFHITSYIPCHLIHSTLPHTFHITTYIPHHLIHSTLPHTDRSGGRAGHNGRHHKLCQESRRLGDNCSRSHTPGWSPIKQNRNKHQHSQEMWADEGLWRCEPRHPIYKNTTTSQPHNLAAYESTPPWKSDQ